MADGGLCDEARLREVEKKGALNIFLLNTCSLPSASRTRNLIPASSLLRPVHSYNLLKRVYFSFPKHSLALVLNPFGEISQLASSKGYKNTASTTKKLHRTRWHLVYRYLPLFNFYKYILVPARVNPKFICYEYNFSRNRVNFASCYKRTKQPTYSNSKKCLRPIFLYEYNFLHFDTPSELRRYLYSIYLLEKYSILFLRSKNYRELSYIICNKHYVVYE